MTAVQTHTVPLDLRATIAPPLKVGERLEVLGTLFDIRSTSAESDGAHFSFSFEGPPGIGVPTHVHDHEDELFVMRRGTIRFVVDGHESILRAGETLFAPRNLPHAWEIVGDEAAEAIVTILPGNLEGMFSELATLPKGPPDLVRLAAICAPYGVRFL